MTFEDTRNYLENEPFPLKEDNTFLSKVHLCIDIVDYALQEDSQVEINFREREIIHNLINLLKRYSLDCPAVMSEGLTTYIGALLNLIKNVGMILNDEDILLDIEILENSFNVRTALVAYAKYLKASYRYLRKGYSDVDGSAAAIASNTYYESLVKFMDSLEGHDEHYTLNR